jgi:cysteinyl-tRNA synthetase
MSLHYLQGHVDLHLGGIDLRFPHHENERAQSNCAAMSEVTDQWVHGEHLLFEGRKMSKSSKNVVLLSDLIERGFDPLALRLVFLENKYRSQMDLTWVQISAADSTLKRWRSKYQEWAKSEVHNDPEITANLEEEIYDLLRHDLDTPAAILRMRAIERDSSISALSKAQIFAKLDQFFGLEITRASQAEEISTEVEELLQLRERARAKKDFESSDRLRDLLITLNIKVIDTASGQSWEIIP